LVAFIILEESIMDVLEFVSDKYLEPVDFGLDGSSEEHDNKINSGKIQIKIYRQVFIKSFGTPITKAGIIAHSELISKQRSFP
tara:strand:- start:50 stop:298 length:249 start_codon:yes stop_codon:yes gene_type:complete